jgi:carboxypeptidase family protein
MTSNFAFENPKEKIEMESAFRNNWTRLLLAVVVLGLCVGASAQVSKGSISGTVVDATGAIVSGAEVKATSVETNLVITTKSDGSGLFKLPLLSVGSYRVDISREGFRKASLAAVGVTPGVDTGLGTIKLEIGSVAETVEVTAATPLIETTQAQVTATFDQASLNSLPGIGGNEGLDNLAILLPGVSMARSLGFSNSNGVDFSVNGLRARDNDQQIDGQFNNDNSVAGPSIFMSDTNFVDEYQVVSNNFGAEYGRNAGSVINITTKSGSNTWHGAIYGSESNSVLTSLTNQQKEFEGLTKPPRFNDEFTGATIGGPWKKDKIFFFGGFDNEIISSKGVLEDSGLTPTPFGITQMAGCWPTSTAVAALQTYGPFGVGGGNPVIASPPTTVDYTPSDKNGNGVLLGTIPNPNDGSTGCDVQLSSVSRTLGNGSHQYNWVSRLDINGNGGKDSVYVRYIFQKETFFNVDEGNGGAGYPVNVPSLGQDLGVSWTHKISNNMLNEARGSIGRENVQFGGNTIGNTVPVTSGLLGGLANIRFAATNLLGFGPLNNLPQGRIVNTLQAQDNWSYVHGKHQFKAGFNYTFQKSPNVFLPYTNGGYQFQDWGFYGANIPTINNIDLGTPKLDFLEHDSFFYFADDWKITPHLTLNLGITYSYYGQPANLFNKNDLRQQTSSEPFWLPSLPNSVTVFPNLPAPKNSWGPSIGFAYAVGNGGRLLGDNKTVFRGGYRLSYDPPFYNIYLNIASSSPQVLAQTIGPMTVGGVTTQPPGLPAVPTGPNVRSSLASFLTLGVQDPRNFDQTSVVPNFRPDHVHSWSFGIQRELNAHAAFEARYVGNRGENLFQSNNGNPYVGCGDAGCVVPSGPLAGSPEAPGLADAIAAGVFKSSLLPTGATPCSTANAVVTAAIGRENCNLGVQRIRTNTAYSAYEGLQLEFRTTNLFKQLTMRANYTWSKDTDNASEIFGTFSAGGTVAFSQDPFNNGAAEHGLSGLDFPQTGQISFTEAIPFYRSQQGVLGHALGGWSLSGSYILQSGQTYTPVEFFSAYFLSPYNVSDQAFLGGFNSGSDTARPFISNTAAPANAIGVYASDACLFAQFEFGQPSSAPACVVAASNPTALLDFTAFNGSGGVTANTTTKAQEHFILNSYQSQVMNGTPFGNAARNSLRNYHTNVASLDLAKTSNIGERVRLIWDMQMQNVFNHAQYAGIDPFLEDAGDFGFGTGFANPLVQNSAYQNGASNRLIKFKIRITF